MGGALVVAWLGKELQSSTSTLELASVYSTVKWGQQQELLPGVPLRLNVIVHVTNLAQDLEG